MSRAAKVVLDQGVGLMCTVTPDGVPNARWMTALLPDGLKRIITLSAADARKIDDLRAHPEVCWIFTAEHFHDVVTLHGRVVVHDSALAGMEAWDRLTRAVQTYAFSSIREADDPRVVTIETIVEQVELLSPGLELFTPQKLGRP